jgi:hypothetical protein
LDIQLLKQLGNISQIAGIRESTLIGGRGHGLRIAEFYNAAGLRFTVCPDRCMDILDLSYKGVNISFQSKNGIVSGSFTSPLPEAFSDQWPGGMLFTCGLDNVGGGYTDGTIYPTHGRISGIPAEHFGTDAAWLNNEYLLCAKGEMRQTRLYGRHLLLSRRISATLNSRSLTLNDRITNLEPAAEPFMLLYHVNFGYPILTEKSLVYTSDTETVPLNSISEDSKNMTAPVDGRGEEAFFHTAKTKTAWGCIINPSISLGAYVLFDTADLPYFIEWKNMRSHDYVLAVEPCNCRGIGRAAEQKADGLAVLPGYSSLEYELTIGLLDGEEEIARFLAGEQKT